MYLLAIIRDSTDLLQTEKQCRLSKTAYSTTIYGTIVSMFAIAIERHTASDQFQTYEQTSNAFGYKLALSHVLIVACLSAGYAMYGYYDPLVALCTITPPRVEIYNYVFGTVVITMEIWTLALFVKLLKTN
ncbi:hypothetical protein PENTCL1PPCAC_20304, partial [Pristionchus entomophagus]